MRFLPVIAAFLCGVLFAQAQESTARADDCDPNKPSAAMLRARAEAEHIRKLVEAGALPRLKLEEAEQALARLKDEEILQRTLYGSLTVEDLTEVQTQEMVEAARRQLRLSTAASGCSQETGGRGRCGAHAITPVLEDFDRSGRTVDLAESAGAPVPGTRGDGAQRKRNWPPRLRTNPKTARKIAERFDGSGNFTQFQLAVILGAYAHEFAKPLPVSAQGSTAFHRSLGFDHRGRVDVAVHPDQKEGCVVAPFSGSTEDPVFRVSQIHPR